MKRLPVLFYGLECSTLNKTQIKLKAPVQCIPPPRHVLPMLRYRSPSTYWLTWLSVVGRWRDDVILAMPMSASEWPALQRRAAQSIDTTFRISLYWRIRKTIPVSRRWSRSPSKFSRLFTGPLRTFTVTSCKSVWKFLRKVANRQADRQTDQQWRKHYLLGGGNHVTLQ